MSMRVGSDKFLFLDELFLLIIKASKQAFLSITETSVDVETSTKFYIVIG